MLTLAVPLPAAAEPTGPATPGQLLECESLIDFDYAGTVITAAERVADGAETNAGASIGEYCVVTGHMNERVSDVDGQTYRIGFEMRLPADWAGRFLYQANGGLDGNVSPAQGSFTGGQLQTGVQQGFAVISSDAGHSGAQIPLFGLDPQARLDYGYQAVGTLTPMAKALVEAGYGRGPDTSYIAGGSNGGRHTMVAAARYADLYDGFFAIAPGFHLPQAAVAQIWGAQQWNEIATTAGDLSSAFTAEERGVVAAAVLDRCDGLDGLDDGLVQASALCQQEFDVERDVPSCSDVRDGTCLSAAQKAVLSRVFAGAVTSDGAEIYAPFPYDAGITNDDWAGWKFNNSVALDPAAVGFVFSTPPQSPSILSDLPGWALSADIDELAEGIWASGGEYDESGMSFMAPPDESELAGLHDNGGKLLVVHGTSDPVFSAADTAGWYDELTSRYGDETADFARYFEVPGMGHVRGGAATDQFDGLAAIVEWVEQGVAPDAIVATARGEGNAGGVNAEIPADWAADRTRPLCAYPSVALYVEGDPESASSFVCGQATGSEPEPEPQPTPEPTPQPTGDPDPGSGPGTGPDSDAGTAASGSSTTGPDRDAGDLAATGGGVPLWLPALGAVMVAAGAVSALALRRRRRH